MMDVDDSKNFEIIGYGDIKQNEVVRPTVTYWQDAMRRLKKHKLSMIAAYALILLTILVIIGPFINGTDYLTIVRTQRNQPPSAKFWFGTDNLGRNLFTRVWRGARVSMLVAVACSFVQVVIGSVYGSIMSYKGGRVDAVMMRIIEILTAMPSLLMTIFVMMIFGNGMFTLLVALSITSWCNTARMVRGLTLQLRSSDFVMAAQALGAPPSRVIWKHLIPNMIGVLIITTAASIPVFIFGEAGLSFLGLGLQTPQISLGVLISDGKNSMDFYPHLLFMPAMVLCLIVLAFNIFGDGLRNALDPRMRQ